jgi:hypothetical protein
MQVEATLAQLTAGQFTSSYPFSCPPPSAATPPSAVSTTQPTPFPQSHAELAIPLEDVVTIWLNELGIGFDMLGKFRTRSFTS